MYTRRRYYQYQFTHRKNVKGGNDLFLSVINGKYTVSDDSQGAIAELKAPIISENGCEYELRRDDNGYSGNSLFVSDAITDCGSGLFLITRKLQNKDFVTRKFRIIFDADTLFKFKKYLIPCVSYNGNKFGEGKEPKGLSCNGEMWLHAYDRVSIPSCTLSENDHIVFSIFVSDRNKESLESCCGMAEIESGMKHRIMWPVNEQPYTYADNDKMVEPLFSEITLVPDEFFETSFYVFAGIPKWKNYGFATLFDRAYKLFNNHIPACRSNEELWRLGIEYLHSLVEYHNGEKLLSNGQKPNATGKICTTPLYEIGWCGQNASSCRMFIIDSLKTHNKELLNDALEILDNWVSKQADNGLLLAHYEWYKNGKEWNYVPKDPNKSWASNVDWINGWLPEVCNLGWAALELLLTWKVLMDNGIEKNTYRDFSLKICDFFIEHYSDEYAFGKGWDFEGNCIEKDGTIGGFISIALIEAYRITGERRYLDCAVKSVDFYFDRDIDHFVCTAGAIDCTCVDKETAAPFIKASVDLYEITHDEGYIEKAKRAAYYFLSWMFCYDIVYDNTAEFTVYGYRTSGGTSVSVQHPAIDQYGELIVYDLLRLSYYTNEEIWCNCATMIWNNCMQCIADEHTKSIHGKKRPIGAQNEAFYHCRWGHRPDCNERGHLNDWLVSWVSSYRLLVINKLETTFDGELLRLLQTSMKGVRDLS